jgi:hypothetical protein
MKHIHLFFFKMKNKIKIKKRIKNIGGTEGTGLCTVGGLHLRSWGYLPVRDPASRSQDVIGTEAAPISVQRQDLLCWDRRANSLAL